MLKTMRDVAVIMALGSVITAVIIWALFVSPKPLQAMEPLCNSKCCDCSWQDKTSNQRGA